MVALIKNRGSKTNPILTTITFIIFWDFLIVKKVFYSPQVKRSVIISNKLVYKVCHLPHELPNDLRFRILGKYKENVKISLNYCLVLSPSPRNENPTSNSKNPLKDRNWTPPTVRHSTHRGELPAVSAQPMLNRRKW